MFQTIDGMPEGVIAIRGVGRVTADGYRAVLVPAIERATSERRKVRLYLELGEGFEGYDASAVLADTTVGIGHLGSFERIAVVTDTDWLRGAVHLFGPLIPGEARVFSNAEWPAARDWISAPEDVVVPTPRGQPAPPKGLLGFLLGLPRYLFRAHLGVLLGHRFLLLVHVGRRTGQRHETPLEVVRYEPASHEAVVAAAWGRKTQWLHNVEAGLAREVWISRERYRPTYRLLDVEEAASTLQRYEEHSGLPKALIRAVLSRALGWRYDGSAQARQRAVEQMTLLGLRPAQRVGQSAAARE